MFVSRYGIAGVVSAGLLGVVSFAPDDPARAQAAPRRAVCVEGDQTLPQLQRELDEAKDALRVYWAQRNPSQLGQHQRELRSAVAQQRITPEFERIADDLTFYLAPDTMDFLKPGLQQEMLQLADRIERMVPASSQPLPEDRALAGRLKLAVARANQRQVRAMGQYIDEGCLSFGPKSRSGLMPGDLPQPDRPMFIRASSLAIAQTLSSEPSTELVCAETQQVLSGLETEEKQAEEAVRIHWALDNVDNLQLLLEQLRTAQQAGTLAPSLERIATGLLVSLPAGASQAAKLRAQGEVLQLLVRVDSDLQAILDGSRPTPDFLNNDTPRGDLELSLERTRYQAGLRRERMAALNCSQQALPAVEPFPRRADPAAPGGPPAPGPNTAQVCAETKAVLVQLERDAHAAYLLRWAMADDYYDSDFAIVELRKAEQAGRISPAFDELASLFGMNPKQMTRAQKVVAQQALRAQIIALADRVRAMTGRPSDDLTDPDAASSPVGAVFDALSAPPQVDPAVRAKELEIEQDWQQAQYQVGLRRQRVTDLNCDSLPTTAVASDNGTLQRISTRLKEDSEQGIQSYSYGDNWAEKLIVGDPPDRRRIRWTFAGVPGSLSPGDEFTITVTGELDFRPAGAERGANNSAGVRAEGLKAIREDNAYFYQGDKREGTYIYQVPLDATRVVIELGADNNQGTFIRHCYGACTP